MGEQEVKVSWQVILEVNTRIYVLKNAEDE